MTLEEMDKMFQDAMRTLDIAHGQTEDPPLPEPVDSRYCTDRGHNRRPVWCGIGGGAQQILVCASCKKEAK